MVIFSYVDSEPCLGNELFQFALLIDLYKIDFQKDQSKELFYYQILENHNFRATFKKNLKYTENVLGFDGV